MLPSTDWREQVAPDEAERFERYARDFTAMQERKSRKYGNGRALHRKQLLGLQAVFEVLPDLPAPARYGLFATPGRHDAWVRLSNGDPARAADARPDIRGFAIKVFGVAGPGALGAGDAASQDFLLINQPAFAFPKSDEFVGLAMAVTRGGGALLKYVFGRYGIGGGLRLMSRLAKTMAKPFSGFATETFFSCAPIACGPYAVRLRLLPASDRVAANAAADWARDIQDRLAQAPLTFDVQLQFFTDEATTPIEDASVDWPAPYVMVGRLHVPQQEVSSDLQDKVEAAAFDPWSALMDHRPLGDVMRARKVVYFASQKTRGAV
jgi:hypothetical protein